MVGIQLNRLSRRSLYLGNDRCWAGLVFFFKEVNRKILDVSMG